MKVQVLVATTNQTDHSLVKKMNIQSDAIICNQCDKNEFERFEYSGHNILWISLKERGVGLNRNNALMRATGDIILFADDDMIYDNHYVDYVIQAFNEIPNADVIIFNLKEKFPIRYINKKVSRIGRMNYLRYGTVRIAAKLSAIKKNAIYFNQCFGGGTEHAHGEDSLFLTACLEKNLKIYAYPKSIAELTEERESTWNTGYNKKYLMDQGALYFTISPNLCSLLCMQDVLRHNKEYERGLIESYRLMKLGVKKMRNY